MNNVIIKLLDPEQYYLLEEFCKEEDIPILNPEWSKVIVAIDEDKVIGIMAAQMLLHVEPIIIKEGYRNGKISKDMSDALDGYLDGLAGYSGHPIEAWCNPTNPAAERICRTHGYSKVDNPMYFKRYNGDKFSELVTNSNLNDVIKVTKE